MEGVQDPKSTWAGAVECVLGPGQTLFTEVSEGQVSHNLGFFRFTSECCINIAQTEVALRAGHIW